LPRHGALKLEGDIPVNESQVFTNVLKLATSAERAAYLDEACAGDPPLRAGVEALLQAHASDPGFLEQPVGVLAGTVDVPAGLRRELPPEPGVTEQPGVLLAGRYKLLQQIGEGGMGTVFMAEQTEPVQRKVALKLIKSGMDSQQVIARFEAERQALALMDHPNIARVLDAGATASGRPYFVMELVKGVPITKYCDEHHLTPRQRLELFVPVCQAVQHAHQKGIIHRDLKPSNVMVCLYDGKPVPKVIDFGVAKAAGPKLTEKTLFTELGQVVGTLEYMSPEQAELNQLDIDTRSDIYSLGVLLYELLTGTTPLERKRFQAAAFLEVLRLIREEESPRPRTRLSTTEGLPSIAANRGLEPKKLSGLLRGELDWIVMKTLEKDCNRRYETANGLAMDVQRYLADEAVQACPPSATYRLKKFLRRNKGPVLAAALVLFALVGGIVGTTWGLVREAERAEGERDAKEEALAAAKAERQAKHEALAAAEAEKKAKEIAQEQEAATRAVLDFVENKVFAAARPEGRDGGLGHAVTLRQAVEAALPFMDTGFAKQPLVEARLRMTLGTSFLYLGDAKAAAEQFQKARTIYTKHRGPDHRDTLGSMHGLANSYSDLGRLADALKLREETLALRKAKLGLDHRDTLASMCILALSYAALGRHVDALKLYKETLALQRAKLGPDDRDTLASMNNMANTYAALGREADALELREETRALMQTKLGPNHLDTVGSMVNLADSYVRLGRHADALKLYEETLAARKAKLPPDHPQTLVALNHLAQIYFFTHGRPADALKLLKEALALRKAKFGPVHPETVSTMYSLAHTYVVVGRGADVPKLFEETLALVKAKLGPDHPDTLQIMNCLAGWYYQLGRQDEALKLQEKTLALWKTKLGPDHPDRMKGIQSVAAISIGAVRNAEALRLLEDTLALWKARLGPDHPDTLENMAELAHSYTFLHRHADAINLYEQTIAVRKVGSHDPKTLGRMQNLVQIYAALGRHADAIKLQEEVLVLRKAKFGNDHLETLGSMSDLARAYHAAGRHAAGLKLHEEILALQKATHGPDSATTLLNMNRVAESYEALGRHADAVKLRQETLALMKAKLGPDSAHTLRSMGDLAASLVRLNRGGEAVPIIDECARRSVLEDSVIFTVMELRLRHFEKRKDAAGCRVSAQMWEKRKRTDAQGLYRSACYRAVTAAVLRACDKSEKSAKEAEIEADRAMAWLKQTVAADYKFYVEAKDLDALRDRPDFKKLVAGLETGKDKNKK